MGDAETVREALRYGRPVGMGSNDSALAALSSLEAENKKLREAVERGRVFERTYQASLGATWTTTQQELLDSTQSAFLDAYTDALSPSQAEQEAKGGTNG